MTTKTTRSTKAPAEEPRPWDKLLAAQKAFEEAEREYGHSHDWLSARQKYTTLDRIDEAMEELVYDTRSAPGLHIVRALPDLTLTANLLLTELRGRLMRSLNLITADKEMRQRRGMDR
jgi:hypothetical protein